MFHQNIVAFKRSVSCSENIYYTFTNNKKLSEVKNPFIVYLSSPLFGKWALGGNHLPVSTNGDYYTLCGSKSNIHNFHGSLTEKNGVLFYENHLFRKNGHLTLII